MHRHTHAQAHMHRHTHTSHAHAPIPSHQRAGLLPATFLQALLQLMQGGTLGPTPVSTGDEPHLACTHEEGSDPKGWMGPLRMHDMLQQPLATIEAVGCGDLRGAAVGRGVVSSTGGTEREGAGAGGGSNAGPGGGGSGGGAEDRGSRGGTRGDDSGSATGDCSRGADIGGGSVQDQSGVSLLDATGISSSSKQAGDAGGRSSEGRRDTSRKLLGGRELQQGGVAREQPAGSGVHELPSHKHFLIHVLFPELDAADREQLKLRDSRYGRGGVGGGSKAPAGAANTVREGDARQQQQQQQEQYTAFQPAEAAATEWGPGLQGVARSCGAGLMVEHGSLLVAACAQVRRGWRALGSSGWEGSSRPSCRVVPAETDEEP